MGRTVEGMTDVRMFWVAGRPATSTEFADVANPYDGSVVGVHAVPTAGRTVGRVGSACAPRGVRPPRDGEAAEMKGQNAAAATFDILAKRSMSSG